MSENKIHQSAIISPTAKIGKDVKIGAFSILGDNVEIGDNCEIMHHSIIDKNTKLGKGSKIYPFCSIGTDPQDITFKGEDTFVEMGDFGYYDVVSFV